MKCLYFSLLLLFIGSNFCAAQDSKGRTTEIQLPADSVYNRLIDFAFKEGLFIADVDKSTKFVLLSIIRDNEKSFFSTSIGERLSYSFIIREKSKSSSVLSLQVKVEENLYKSSGSYYVDKGVTNERSYYDTIFQQFQQFIHDR